MSNINPSVVLKYDLPKIEKPARYLGGENGSIVKLESDFNICLCFPDLYEIGMSNNAMKILYAGINKIKGISCERLFAIDLDYEILLRSKNIKLYGLESGRPVSSFDLLAFTIGYELLATNILSILELSDIPLFRKDRKENHPLVIAGGPAITNPVPYSEILDAVWIGEAENSFFQLIEKLRLAKISGATRSDLMVLIKKEAAIWVPGKTAIRNIYEKFSTAPYDYSFPVPIVKPIQDHGVVEIMRGCPNGCRFCHAGYYYRPQRFRTVDRLLDDISAQIEIAGQREISLSSLSSGDYPGIVHLISLLNKQWASKGVSFQLPSLKIESFPLELIENISGIRKSGLTFAIETPLEQWQLSINKIASIEKIIEILAEASKRGYRVAKFYFMVGLPLSVSNTELEVKAIISFINDIIKSVPIIRLNINIATFVPKPHTPFQWCSQLHWEIAAERIFMIKDAFRSNSRIKISYHAPFLSWIEGMISRGDENTSLLILEAYKQGARFDAWDDKFNKKAWEIALEKFGSLTAVSTLERDDSLPLPWSDISIHVSKKYLKEERKKALEYKTTRICSENCSSQCGSCSSHLKIKDDLAIKKYMADLESLDNSKQFSSFSVSGIRTAPSTGSRYRILFSYLKTGRAAFFAHHEFYSMLNSSLERSSLSIAYSQGFNPMPRLEISEPLSLGFESIDEYGLLLLTEPPSSDLDTIILRANSYLHKDMKIKDFYLMECSEGLKVPSLSSIHWGSKFILDLEHSGIEASPLFNLLISYFNTNELLSRGSISLEDSKIALLIPFTGKKEFSLSSIFERLNGKSIRDCHVAVSRLSQYAKVADSKKVSYFDFYKGLI